MVLILALLLNGVVDHSCFKNFWRVIGLIANSDLDHYEKSSWCKVYDICILSLLHDTMLSSIVFISYLRIHKAKLLLKSITLWILTWLRNKKESKQKIFFSLTEIKINCSDVISFVSIVRWCVRILSDATNCWKKNSSKFYQVSMRVEKNLLRNG